MNVEKACLYLSPEGRIDSNQTCSDILFGHGQALIRF